MVRTLLDLFSMKQLGELHSDCSESLGCAEVKLILREWVHVLAWTLRGEGLGRPVAYRI